MDVTVCIGTYGEVKWIEMARRAALSVLGCPVIHVHGKTLAEARNEAVERAKTEWVIHLDADDKLDAGYVHALSAADGDLLVPMVRYIRNGRIGRPGFPQVAGHSHDCTADCLEDGNWMVVGTAVRRQMVKDVGGWREWEMYEDWDLFRRCWLAGATATRVPSAHYLAHFRAGSRNRAPSAQERQRVHTAIVQSTR